MQQWIFVVRLYIAGDLVVVRSRHDIKDSMLNLVASKISGDIEGVGSDLNIYTENIIVKNLKKFKTITFNLHNDIEKKM